MITFLSLFPAVVLMFIAQLGRKSRPLSWLLYFLLVMSDLLFLLAGLALLFFPAQSPLSVPQLGTLTAQDLHYMGKVLVVTGIVALLLLLPPVQWVLARFMRIRPGDPVHTYALTLAAYALGGTMSQVPLLQLLENLDQPLLTASELVGQAVAFVLLAFVGVGVGIQRSFKEACRRLGLVWPGRREVKVAVVATLFLVALQMVVGALWMALSPESLKEVDQLSKTLLGEFFNLWGALFIGLAAGISEELVFRGALQPRFGLLITSFLFAGIHVQYAMTPALLLIFLLGLVLGIVRNRTNTTAAILTHAAYNTLVVLLAIYAPNLTP
ncbi:MAG: CPBP family intramembrane metalloprotease [Chloroflexi bacterium]|nr:CPBP family intramembrane metalloprotease [Chloroflexota bacterium]